LERDWQGGTVRIAGLGSFLNDIGRATTIPNRLDTVLEDDHALGSVAFRKNDQGRRVEGLVGFHSPKLVNRSDRFDGDTGLITRRSDTVNESFDVNGSGLLERPHGSGAWLAGTDAFVRTGVEAEETTTRYTGGVAGNPDAVQLVEDGLQSDTGIFAGWKKTVKESGQLLLAARGDWSHRSADGQETTEWISPSLNASIVVPVSGSVRVSGILARTFRAPQIQEMYFEGNRPSGFRLPNPDLEPETAYSLEGGVQWQRSEWSAYGSLWGMLADDFIAQLPVDAAGDTLRFENVSEGELFGFDAAFGWAPRDGTQATIEYAYTHGEDGDGGPLPDIPAGEITIAAHHRFWSQQEKNRSATARFSIQAGGAKTPIADGSSEAWYSNVLGSTEVGGDEVGHRGFSLLNAGLLFRVHRAAALDVAVTNILDARQIGRPEADAYPDPGRSLHAELRLEY
jgi:outer membrane receptor protein involved in Fe transport